ncbi:MAG: hypothetical protein UT67_C0014G0017 [Candidatus Magasanikbacteria bacterium GW2011_GWA2_40_10]|uniref:Uncharacterized protein n=1 Tax=Candidatus Magasanikbacteria bacterium GW2011_GWA2_40_10 TaxID=1619037 RepID=A0A0G0SIG9_9BACT|nr:MAG: hypothetical protein UT67_C0014G0017 [Candidatus Magasanikbacteria bacterium GW2011_GWA2_40_10]
MSKTRANGSRVTVRDRATGKTKEGRVTGTGTKRGSSCIPYTANRVQYDDGTSELVCTEESGGPGNSVIKREVGSDSGDDKTYGTTGEETYGTWTDNGDGTSDWHKP